MDDSGLRVDVRGHIGNACVVADERRQESDCNGSEEGRPTGQEGSGQEEKGGQKGSGKESQRSQEKHRQEVVNRFGKTETGSDPSRETGFIKVTAIPLRERGQTPFPFSVSVST